MPELLSTTSTDTQDISSAGAFKISSTKPWFPGQSITFTPETSGSNPPLAFGWEHVTEGAEYRHFFSISSSHAKSDTAELATRLLSHIVVDLLPREALDELLEELAEIWEFHQPVPAPEAPLPGDTQRTLRGTITERYERPTYALTED